MKGGIPFTNFSILDLGGSKQCDSDQCAETAKTTKSQKDLGTDADPRHQFWGIKPTGSASARSLSFSLNLSRIKEEAASDENELGGGACRVYMV